MDQAGGLDDRDTERLFDCFSEEEKEQFKQYLERLEQAIIGQLDPEHAKEYTFERMKEMHDYILAQNPRERVRSHHHAHGMGMDGSPRGERATRGERQEGPFHGEGPQGPFCGGLGVVRRMMRTSSGGDLGDGGRWASVWNRRNKRIMLIRS